MAKYLLRRLLFTIPTLFGATLIIFFILRVLPGDVALLIVLGPEGEGTVDPAALEKVREQLGLNRPLYIQYITWVFNMARGDFGNSLWSGHSVGREILHRAPITIQIAMMATVIGFLLGIPLGLLSALRRGTVLDATLRVVAVGGLAVPSFWMGLLALLTTWRIFNWVPPSGYNLLWQHPAENLLQLMWPAMALALHELAWVMRLTRSSMLDVLGEDYIRTARAKGLPPRTVYIRHALKNTLIPVVTFSGLAFAGLMGGTVALELVFTIPGLGLLFIDSVRHRDYTLVQGMFVWLITGFILVNLVVDLVYSWLDPRISYS